jgi:cytochrome c biogenesis protein CcdA
MMKRNRLLIALTLVTPLGFATKFYQGPGEHFVRSYLGGSLYEVFWVLAVLLVWPGLSPFRVAAGVLTVTVLLEFAQLWHPPFLQAIRSTFLGHALLGSTFSWLDLPCYVAGCLLALLGCRLCHGRNPR